MTAPVIYSVTTPSGAMVAQPPRVKSGTSTAEPPLKTERSLRSTPELHSAGS